MNKITFLFMSLLALICLVFSINKTLEIIDYYKENEKRAIAIQNAIRISKNMVEDIYSTIRLNAKPNARKDIRDVIAKINYNNYKAKAYAFNQLGFYIAHYSKTNEGYNAFLERDIKDIYYLKELINDLSNNEGYKKATIFWTKNTLREIITYIKKDSKLNIYYGCTVDLDSVMLEKNKYKKYKKRGDKTLIIISSVVVVFLISLLCFKIIRKNKEYL